MTNLTLSIEDDVLRAARKLAAERETTVNAMVRVFLQDLVAKQDRAARVRQELLDMSENSQMEIGEVTWTRDDLYKR